MKPASASLLLLALLAASLSLKAIAFGAAHDAPALPVAQTVASYLQAKGMAVTLPQPGDVTPWVTGTAGRCRVRIAAVDPQGWSRDFVAVDAAGQTLRYWFAGRAYDAQPLAATYIAEYGNRLLRYFGLPAPVPRILAVTVSPGCADGLLTDADAAALT